jgi:hypothetical protein
MIGNMPAKLSEYISSSLIPAIEENLREWRGYYGSAPQSEMFTSSELQRFYTGVPFHFLNGMICRQLAPERVNLVIAETMIFFQPWNFPWSWVVAPHPSPA